MGAPFDCSVRLPVTCVSGPSPVLICVVPLASQPAPLGEISNSSLPMDFPSSRILNLPLSGCSTLAELFFWAGSAGASPQASSEVNKIEKIDPAQIFILDPPSGSSGSARDAIAIAVCFPVENDTEREGRRKNQGRGF